MDKYKKVLSVKGSGLQKGNTFRKASINPELSENIPESLIEIENQIEKLKNNVWESAWYIGKRLIAIKDNFLEETGFTNIGLYAESKFGFTHQTAYNFIYLAEKFDLLKVLLMGSKLYLLKGLDEKKFHKYLDWIEKDNPPYNEIITKLRLDKPGRPPKEINLSRYKLTVNFRKLNIKFNKDTQKNFLADLKALIERYKTMT